MALTYEKIIDEVEREIRGHDAFPDAATKLQEQLDAVYRYAVALSKDVPLSKLNVELSSALAISPFLSGLVNAAALPADVNPARPDLGVAMAVLKDTVSGKEDLLSLEEFMPLTTLKAVAGNGVQADNYMASFDFQKRNIYFVPAAINEVKVYYAKEIAVATSGNYTSVEVSLDKNTTDVLIEALCAHFTSVNAKDLSASQIHSTLSQILKE